MFHHGPDFYGGYRYFVCESLTRRAAQMIVDALGGYLVPEIIPPSRQIGTGGPFHVHVFLPRAPNHILSVPGVAEALYYAEEYSKDKSNEAIIYRVYDNSGFMVAEFNG